MRSITGTTVLVLSLLACSATEPIALEEFVSFEKNGLVVGAVVLACGSSWTELPGGDPLVLDFFLNLDAEEGNLAPKEADVRALEAAGATILRRFQVAGVRAEVPRSALSVIVAPEHWNPNINHVRTVPRTDRFDLRVSVGYQSEAEDRIQQRAMELGGHIDDTLPGYPGGVPSFQGVLPDDAIRQLRTEFPEELVFVQHSQVFCLDG